MKAYSFDLFSENNFPVSVTRQQQIRDILSRKKKACGKDVELTSKLFYKFCMVMREVIEPSKQFDL